ncbi:MAG: hypothetical protein IJJ47_11205 [Methanosphaera sp.]|nr:hypothetical protein [Methanosphaera sp.]
MVDTLTQYGISDTKYHHVNVTILQNKYSVVVDNVMVINKDTNFTDKLRVNFTRTDTSSSSKVKNMVIYHD